MYLLFFIVFGVGFPRRLTHHLAQISRVTSPLKDCEFEETEYRGPLFDQLATSRLLWEPGQVFEKHIGIDRAFFTTHDYLRALHGYSPILSPFAGAMLSRYDWEYIWMRRRTKKKLPPFRLNLFIQAKRPQYGRYAPRVLRDMGLRSPYWKFNVTPHQQVALQRLHSNLKDRAIVCYACPVFHKQSDLYKWTVEPRMVENSTFPDVEVLRNHSAWNFYKPGAEGIANIEPTPSNAPSLLERVALLVNNGGQSLLSDAENSRVAQDELQFLSKAVRLVMESVEDKATHSQARFFEGLREIQEIVDEDIDSNVRDAFVAYATVKHFCHLNRLNWLVAGFAHDP